MADRITRLEESAGRNAGEFVLHSGQMLLLDTVIECHDDTTVCEWTVRESDAFIQDGNGIPAYVGVEYMAQCVAVHAGVRAQVEGFGPPLGFLLGSRHFSASVAYLSVGEVYSATCDELIRDSNGMGSYDCSIVHGGNTVATARLAVLEKERGSKL